MAVMYEPWADNIDLTIFILLSTIYTTWIFPSLSPQATVGTLHGSSYSTLHNPYITHILLHILRGNTYFDSLL